MPLPAADIFRRRLMPGNVLRRKSGFNPLLVLTMRRFSVRLLLVVTAVIAVLAAMTIRRAILQRRGREWIAAQRGHVAFMHDYRRESVWYGAGSNLKVPAFAIDLLGVDMFNPVTAVVFDCDELTELKPLTDLSSLRAIEINIEMADDIDFAPLADLPSLRTIHFTEWSFVTPQQLDALHELLPDVDIVSDSDPKAGNHGG